jgi:pantoate--beta-alanine ligase
VRTLRTIREVRAALHEPREQGQRIALVPTMGALHDGHLALMRSARSECDLVVVSIFVNPTQFGPDEDLDRYPQDEAGDLEKALAVGVDLIFAPSEEEMYPAGFGTTVDPGPVADGLCGRNRPGHFTGVATVVARLFGIVAPDVAYFGLKDYQQVAVIRRVVADLALPVEIRGIPTVREPDGLAMSSRNAYLSPEERAAAPALFQALQAAGAGFASGERRAEHLLDLARRRLEDAGMEVEYLELRDAETLGEYTPERGAVLAAAVHLGGTRLIDNVLLTPPRLPGLRGPTLATGKVTP